MLHKYYVHTRLRIIHDWYSYMIDIHTWLIFIHDWYSYMIDIHTWLIFIHDWYSYMIDIHTWMRFIHIKFHAWSSIINNMFYVSLIIMFHAQPLRFTHNYVSYMIMFFHQARKRSFWAPHLIAHIRQSEETKFSSSPFDRAYLTDETNNIK
jgi:hypothetical protein